MSTVDLKRRNNGILNRVKSKNYDMWSLIILVAIILGFIFIIYPFSKLFINSFSKKGDQGISLANYATFFSKKYYRVALLNSIKVSLLTTIFATCLGVPMAYLSSRYNIYLKKTINIMVVLSMLSPPFIGAYSWILLLGRNGFITNILANIGIEIGSIYGFKGIILVFTLKLFPFVYLYSSGALGAIDASLEEAAENLGVHGIKKLLTVTFPLILPTILSSSLMVFMTSLADFGTPMLIGEGYKVLPVAIYEEFMSEVGGDISFASALSVVIILCSLFVLWIQNRAIANKNYNMSALRPPEIINLKGIRRIGTTFIVFFVALLAVLPQITVVITSFIKTNGPLFVKGWSFDSYRAIAFKLGRNIRNTFTFSIIAILITIVIGLLISYVIVRKRSKITEFIDMLIMFPYVIPGAVLGISLIVAFNKKPLVLTGTITIMIISFVIRKSPYTLRSSIGILHQIDPSVEEASISLGVPPVKTFFKTTAILMLPGLLSGAVLSFISIINELSSTLILYSGKTGTISVAIFNEIHKDGYGTAAALATILTLTTIISLFIFNKISGGKSVIGS